MKMTMHIDEELLKRVMEATSAATKTEAVRLALTEMDRKTRLAHFYKTGLGLNPADYEGNYWPTDEEISYSVARMNAEGESTVKTKKAKL